MKINKFALRSRAGGNAVEFHFGPCDRQGAPRIDHLPGHRAGGTGVGDIAQREAANLFHKRFRTKGVHGINPPEVVAFGRLRDAARFAEITVIANDGTLQAGSRRRQFFRERRIFRDFEGVGQCIALRVGRGLPRKVERRSRRLDLGIRLWRKWRYRGGRLVAGFLHVDIRHEITCDLARLAVVEEVVDAVGARHVKARRRIQRRRGPFHAPAFVAQRFHGIDGADERPRAL